VSPLSTYLQQVRDAIETFPGARVERYRAELLTASRANLRIRLRLPDDSFLEISEALVVQEGTLTWLSYRYHWQDARGRLIHRYDNAPHHPEVGSFPHHKHVEETVAPSERPALFDLLAEIRLHLTQP
jgi:hypothetical protein